MNRDDVKAIDKVRRDALDRAASALKNNQGASAWENIQTAKACVELLGTTRLPLTKVLALIGGIAAIIVSVMSLTRQASVLWLPTYVIDVKAESTTLNFDQPTDIDLNVQAVSVTSLDADSWLADGRSHTLVRGTEAKLVGSDVDVRQCAFGTSGRLALVSSRGTLEMLAYGSQVSTKVVVSGAKPSLIETQGGSAVLPLSHELSNVNGSVFVDFRALSRMEVPMGLKMNRPGPWTLRNIRPRNMNFTKQVVIDGETHGASSVIEGKVHVADVGRDIELARDDVLTLGDLRVKSLEISGVENYMQIHLEAQSESLRTGLRGLDQESGPTLLELVTRNGDTQRVASTLISVAVALWGLFGLLRPSNALKSN